MAPEWVMVVRLAEREECDVLRWAGPETGFYCSQEEVALHWLEREAESQRS